MCNDVQSETSRAGVLNLETRILARNEGMAAHNREHFRERGVFAINLMGSPGSGKTAVLEATARHFRSGRHLAALAGDLATDHDAARIERAGIRSRSITTGQACHLDAEMVHRELHHLDLEGVEFLFIENVGNLVCPAVYDLGQSINVVALSVTEGEDKPLKYPTMFAKADLVLLTKLDLLQYLPNIDMSAIRESLAQVMPVPQVIRMSAQEQAGVDGWVSWLRQQRSAWIQELAAV